MANSPAFSPVTTKATACPSLVASQLPSSSPTTADGEPPPPPVPADDVPGLGLGLGLAAAPPDSDSESGFEFEPPPPLQAVNTTAPTTPAATAAIRHRPRTTPRA
ncbi:hypothetical protein [Streptomyces sp. TRM70350]|uniref:hypothetical protein n=1 Tax=Streptomyces sp. TRM70350 TaxID=2856165 RepID=UPI0027DF53E6|nr:hypothetical protein [Streptomyces sp. TRM70350]